MDKYSIFNTTKEQRIQIINEALGCGGGGCENCSGQPYIDGKKEISQINMEFRERYTVLGSK